jgi:hypothetical protein
MPLTRNCDNLEALSPSMIQARQRTIAPLKTPAQLVTSALMTLLCWQAARKEATLRATWGPISARSNVNLF